MENWLNEQLNICKELIDLEPYFLIDLLIKAESEAFTEIKESDLDLILFNENMLVLKNETKENKIESILKERKKVWKDLIPNPELFLKTIRPVIIEYSKNKEKTKDFILTPTTH